MGIIESTYSAKCGHPGGSLSAAEMFTYLYFKELNVDPTNPKWEDRDRFVLSKGHTAPGLYSTLALRGYFPAEWLTTLRQTGSNLQGHPCMDHTPGIDQNTGSLGQGVSSAVGMAMFAKMNGKSFRTYALLGDGEIEEGDEDPLDIRLLDMDEDGDGLDLPEDDAGVLQFGTTILYPGKVGDEYFMTKGHFHTILDTSEIYYCLKGKGMMLMETPEGDVDCKELNPGDAISVSLSDGTAQCTVNTVQRRNKRGKKTDI